MHLCVLQDTWLIQNSWALKRYSCLKDIPSVEDNSFAFYILNYTFGQENIISIYNDNQFKVKIRNEIRRHCIMV